MSLPFSNDDLILFTGDSITDCGRNLSDSASLGNGYVRLLVERLETDHPGLKLRFRNTGISGNRTCDLLARWDADCINLQPDWVSILAGINNTWRRYDSNDPTSDDIFEAEYRQLLRRLKEETHARVILCSPFLLHVDAFVEGMRADLDPKIVFLKKLAIEYGAVWVDFDAAFMTAARRRMPSCWAEDGVHPTAAGHALMAETWHSAMCAMNFSFETGSSERVC